MKKFIFLLALVLCLSSLSGIAVIAEDDVASPSVEIAIYTVPMKATVSILYAIEADGYMSFDELKLVADKGSGEEFIAPSGVLTKDGVRYIVFEYSNLSASEMDKRVTACVEYNGNRGKAVSYSVADFAASYASGNGSEKNKAMVAAMIAYGDAVKAMAEAKTAE